MNEKLKYRTFQVAILGAVVLIYLIGWFGPSLIKNYKLEQEHRQINIGGSDKELENSIEVYTKSLDSVSQLIKKTQKNYPFIYVCTNDSLFTPSDVTLYPSLDYYALKKHFPTSQISYIKSATKALNTYLQKEKKVLKVKTKFNNVSRQVKTIIADTVLDQFIIFTYFKPTTEYLNRPIIKMNSRYNLKKDTIRSRYFTYSLNNMKALNKIIHRSAIERPHHYQLYDDTFKFYITYCGSQISEEAFRNYCNDFIKAEFKKVKNKQVTYSKEAIKIMPFFE